MTPAMPHRSIVSDRITAGGLILIHACALVAVIPATFSWPAVLTGFALFYLTSGLGISLGFHRLLTHRSLRCPRVLEYFFVFCGTLALQGGPLAWVATHRVHHAHTDRDGDPHDVHRGLAWSHINWLYFRNDARPSEDLWPKLVPDLIADPFYVFLERTEIYWQIALGFALLAIGGWPMVIWGMFVRLVAAYHVTWLVNSAAHYFGYQTYRTNDRSTNNWWVALLTWGEGWHNNHHAFPFSARHGLRWFEFDVTWITIAVLRRLRLAREVKLPTRAMLERLAASKRTEAA